MINEPYISEFIVYPVQKFLGKGGKTRNNHTQHFLFLHAFPALQQGHFDLAPFQYVIKE